MPQAGIIRPKVFNLNPSAPLARGLVFAALGNAAGTGRCEDSSLLRNHGTLTNMDPATDWVFDSEINRYGLDFNAAASQYINLGTSSAFDTAEHTWSIWVKGQPAGTGTFMSASSTFSLNTTLLAWTFTRRINLDSGGKRWYGAIDAIRATGWTHVCLTKRAGSDAPDMALYLNGVAQSLTYTTEAITYPAFMSIGYGVSYGYIGQRVSGPMCWNRILSNSAIAALANPANVMLDYGGVPLIGGRKRTYFWLPAAAGVTGSPWNYYAQVG